MTINIFSFFNKFKICVLGPQTHLLLFYFNVSLQGTDHTAFSSANAVEALLDPFCERLTIDQKSPD
jgi:hypothetical protein